MLRFITTRKLYAASTGAISLIYGTNAKLTATYLGTNGGGYWELDGSPKADPMRFDSLEGELVFDGDACPARGAYVLLGRLTGEKRDAIEWLAELVTGTGGQNIAKLRSVDCPYGPIFYVGPSLVSADYVLVMRGAIWTT